MLRARKQTQSNSKCLSFFCLYFNKIIFTGSFAAVLILNSCEFSPGDIAETQVEKPSSEVPMIDFEITPETDTLKLAGPVTIKYKFNASPREVHWVDFSFDGISLVFREYEENEPLEMTLDARLYSEGLHELAITVFTSSNSGSIADKVQGEGYLYQLQWPVLIDFTPPRWLKIVGVEKKPGGALIKWEKFSHASFDNYTLEKVAFFDSRDVDLAVIKDANTTEYFDNDYLEGENVYYRIRLNGIFGEGVYYSEPPGIITSTWTSGFDAVVSWNPSQNPDRLDYYRIFQNDLVSPQNEKHIYYGEETQMTYSKLGLGENILINLQNVPKTTNSNFSFSGLQVATTTVCIGEKIPAHELTKKVDGTNTSLMNNGNKLILFDHEKRMRLDSLDFGDIKLRAYRISPDGKVLYTLTENDFQAWSIPGFGNLGSVDLSHISSSLSSLFDISVSSNFRILFSVSGGKIVIYDFANDKVLFAPSEIFGWGKISPNGSQILTRATDVNTYFRCFNLKPGQLTLLGETEFLGQNWGYSFFFSDPDFKQLIICLGNEVQIRNDSDFSLIKKLTLPSGGLVQYDPETNILLSAKNPGSRSIECYLMKLPEGEISDTVYLSPGYIILHRDYLIGRNGSQLNFNNL